MTGGSISASPIRVVRETTDDDACKLYQCLGQTRHGQLVEYTTVLLYFVNENRERAERRDGARERTEKRQEKARIVYDSEHSHIMIRGALILNTH